MSFNRPAAALILLLTAAVLSWETDGFLTEKTLQLERGLPVKGVALDKLKARDLGRAKSHNRRSLSAGVVDFPVDGSANPFTVGLYFTRVKLGNPPKEFYVQIDTGSDILWVTCSGCSGCPKSSGLSIELEFFDPQKSSTASLIGCSDQRCSIAQQSEGAQCPSDSSNSQCLYTFQYGDGSGTQGYYVSDTMYFDTVTESAQITNSSAPVLFGCSNLQSGDLMKPDRAVDGIFGFGQHELSVISQLSSAGVAPKVFSHCLKGSGNGGGILVLGEIVEPGIVYTPLVPSAPHYNLNLQSIAVNGQQLNIDSSVFTTSPTQGTIIDSGTTLAYFSEQVYDTFVNTLISTLQPSLVQSFDGIKDNRCFIAAGSVDDAFPPVTLNFAGGASMSLKPSDYLLPQGNVNSDIIWCIGWQKSEGGTTILGDLVLKDKIVVYDLANQRIGWKNYDCSLSVNVSSSSGKSEFVNNSGQQFDMSGSSRRMSNTMLPASFIVLIVHLCVFISNLL